MQGTDFGGFQSSFNRRKTTSGNSKHMVYSFVHELFFAKDLVTYECFFVISALVFLTS